MTKIGDINGCDPAIMCCVDGAKFSTPVRKERNAAATPSASYISRDRLRGIEAGRGSSPPNLGRQIAEYTAPVSVPVVRFAAGVVKGGAGVLFISFVYGAKFLPYPLRGKRFFARVSNHGRGSLRSACPPEVYSSRH